MHVDVLVFASARDAVGASRVQIELAPGATVAEARDLLVARWPQLGHGARALRFAVDEEFVGLERRLAPGETLALLPPVSGG